MALPLSEQPRDLSLGTDNDLVVTTDLTFTAGVQAVAQSCRIALQIFQGEWFLDLDVGIPYWDRIIAQKPNVAIAGARAAFRKELLAVNGVLAIKRLDVTYVNATRTLNVTWQVSTVFGDTPADSIVAGAPTLSGGS